MKTVFRDATKRWKPRNKQAAMVVRKANDALLHCPPVTTPTFAPTQAQTVVAYCESLKKRIAKADEWRRNRLPKAQRRQIQQEQFMRSRHPASKLKEGA